MTALVVIGAGGAGRETLEMIDAVNRSRSPADDHLEVVGVVDDGEVDADLLASYDVKHLGPVAALHDLDPDVQYLIGIGSPAAKRAIDAEFGRTRSSPVLRHPTATVGRTVTLGPGCIVAPGAIMLSNVVCGRHVYVNGNATVGHDARLDDYVQIGPLSAISGHVHLETGVTAGSGVTINPGVRIGADAVIGANAAVLSDVGSGTTVVGVPARPRP